MFEPANEIPPEYSSVEALAQFLTDDERSQFTFEEAIQVAQSLGYSVPALVIRELKALGFTMTERPVGKRVRGFTSSSHDRYYGPGAEKMHGGSGYEQISGFAGQKG